MRIDPSNDVAVFLTDGSYRSDTAQAGFAGQNVDFTIATGTVTPKSGFSSSDIIGAFAVEDRSDVCALYSNGTHSCDKSCTNFNNGGTVNLDQGDLQTDTYPGGVSLTNALGYAYADNKNDLAVFMDNGSYYADTNIGAPAGNGADFTLASGLYYLKAGYNYSDVLGFHYCEDCGNDVIVYYTDGTHSVDTTFGAFTGETLNFSTNGGTDTYPAAAVLLNVHTNISFQVRTGNTSPTTGDFLGPDGTTSTFYTNSTMSSLNISANQYFQYKAYFHSDNAQRTPKLYNLTVNSNAIPTMTSVQANESTLKGGNNITINVSGADDADNNTLYLYCSDVNNTPTSSNNNCTGGNISSGQPYSTMSCIMPTRVDDSNHTVYCRLYDNTSYSAVYNTSYVSDSTPPNTSVHDVAGDITPTYIDTVNDGFTNITVDGQANMVCRWNTTAQIWSQMGATHDCIITGSQALCSPSPAPSQGTHYYYVGCSDQYGNQQSTAQIQNITVIVDWTAPNSTDNATSGYHVPPYWVHILEDDNLDPNPDTYYCRDTSNSCTPGTTVANFVDINFTSAHRGTNYLRYNSTDWGGLYNFTNKTISINWLPVFTSATDNATTIKGGEYAKISTVSYDNDTGQTLTIFVCNTTNATSGGCQDLEYCMNDSVTENITCRFQTNNTTSITYNWYAYIYDSIHESAANYRSGSFNTDSTAPIVTVIDPDNKTYHTDNVTAAIILDTDGSIAIAVLDGGTSYNLTNITTKYWETVMQGIADGSHTVVFYANDTVGNEGNANVSFAVNTSVPDTAPPVVVVLAPANGSFHTTEWAWLNISTNENCTWAAVSLNGGAVQNLTNASGTSWYRNLTSLTDETRNNLTFYTNDSSDNQGNRTSYIFVDTKEPAYSSATTNNSVANQSQSVKCSAYWTDMNLSSGKVAENSSGNFVNHTATPFTGTNAWTNYTIPGADLTTVSGYACKFYATDQAGNTNTTNTTFTVQDVIAPTITISFPEENKNYTSNDSIPAAIALSEAGAWAGYSLNGGANTTLTNATPTAWSATLPELADGNYNITFYANDSYGNMGSASRNFSVNVTAADTAPPGLALNNLVNRSYYGTTTLVLNVTTDENCRWAGYSLNDGAVTDMSNVSDARTWNATLTLMDQYRNNITIYANDTSANNNQGNLSIIFYIDAKAPVNVSAGTNNSVANQSQSVKCSANWTDMNLSSGKIAENSSGTFVNHTATPFTGTNAWTNYTVPGADLTTVSGYACKFYATDQAGNTNTTNTTFTIQDVTPPTININSPLNTTYNQNWVTASITLSENGTYANYTLDGATSGNLTNATPTQWSKKITGIANGAHTIVFKALDPYGNEGNNSISFVVSYNPDTTAPIITIRSPTNNTYYTSANVLLNITSNENMAWAGYSLNGTANVNLTQNTATNWNKTVTLTESTYNITFYANDSADNQGNTTNNNITFYVDLTNPRNVSEGHSPATVNDSTNVTCYSKWNDSMGLSYGVVEHNESGTPTNTSQQSMSGTSDWLNHTINYTDTSPGNFYCKFYAFDSSGRTNTTTITVNVVDVTNPIVQNISYVPNTTAGLDPNVTINVTADVWDNGILASVVLNYRTTGVGAWNSSNMMNVAGNRYRGNFTPTTYGNYSFKINATDNAGNTNVSGTTVVDVAPDYTYINTTTIENIKSVTYAERSSNNSLGNITLNNTGDYTLNFTINTSWSRVTINGTGNTTLSLLISNGTSTIITIEANTTDLTAQLYDYRIGITARKTTGGIVSSSDMNKSLNMQTAAGPYLSVSIDTYSATVDASQTGVELVASVQNAGTGDSTNAWIYWSLPSDWTITSGSANRTASPLIISATGYNHITVNIGSSTGTKTITASADCAEGTCSLASSSKTVTVGTPTPPIPPDPGGGGMGGGGAGGKSVRPELLTTYEYFDVVRGESNTYPFAVKNIFPNSELDDVKIEIEGYLAQYITYTPKKLNGIKTNETQYFYLTIDAPSYMTRGEYPINVTVRGKIMYSGGAVNTTFVERREVYLIVHEISRGTADDAINLADDDILAMQEAGFSVTKLVKLYELAEENLEKGYYGVAKKLADDIHEIREDAFETYGIIETVEGMIKDAEDRMLEVPETRKIINLAMAAFEREDYETAMDRAQEARSVIMVETGGKLNLYWFLKENWWKIILGALAILSFAYFAYKRLAASHIAEKLRNIAKEELTILGLMEEAQKKHFVTKEMAGDTYLTIMAEYQNRLVQIHKARAKLRSRKVGGGTMQKIDNLDKENEHITNLMKKAQVDYFKERTISKQTYDNRMTSYKMQLAEVEGQRATLEAALEKRKVLRGEKRKNRAVKKRPKTSVKSQVKKAAVAKHEKEKKASKLEKKKKASRERTQRQKKRDAARDEKKKARLEQAKKTARDKAEKRAAKSKENASATIAQKDKSKPAKRKVSLKGRKKQREEKKMAGMRRRIADKKANGEIYE